MLRAGARAAVVAVFVLAWSAFPPAAPAWTPAPGSGVLVVNEIMPGQYVELRNVSLSTMDIGGFNLWLCGDSGVTSRVRLGLGQRLDAGGIYLVASSSYTGAPADQMYSGLLPSGGAVLLDPAYGWADGAAVVADSPCGEGDPAPVCPQGSTARDAASCDTGSNIADFSCRRMSPGEPN